MAQPRIAVAIPTYKRRELLTRLIASVPDDWRIFVSDNDSSLLPMSQQLDARASVSHSPTLVGMFANWNRALSLVDETCTHVFIPSDDDLFLPNAEAAVSAALRLHPEADIIVFGCDLFDEHDRRQPGYCPPRLVMHGPGDGFLTFARGVEARMPGILFRQEFLKRIGAFDESYELTAADSDLIQRALLMGRSLFVPEVIGLYRIWSGSLTHARQATDLWMSEVSRWTDKIVTLLRAGHQPTSRRVDAARFRDEIVALNLLAGMGNLLGKHEFTQAREFIDRHPIPPNARLSTRLRLLRSRWLAQRGAQ